MKQSPSSESNNSLSTDQESLHLSWNPEVHYRVLSCWSVSWTKLFQCKISYSVSVIVFCYEPGLYRFLTGEIRDIIPIFLCLWHSKEPKRNPSRMSSVIFRTLLCFNTERLSLSPAPKKEGYPLSAWLFIQYIRSYLSHWETSIPPATRGCTFLWWQGNSFTQWSWRLFLKQTCCCDFTPPLPCDSLTLLSHRKFYTNILPKILWGKKARANYKLHFTYVIGRYSNRLGAGGLMCNSRQGKLFFFVLIATKPALRPTPLSNLYRGSFCRNNVSCTRIWRLISI
jgi:hypothetical protein